MITIRQGVKETLGKQRNHTILVHFASPDLPFDIKYGRTKVVMVMGNVHVLPKSLCWQIVIVRQHQRAKNEV
jgi:hypothetical protein